MTDTDNRDRSNVRAMVGLCVIVALIVGTVIVMQKLRASAALQECLASGRTNCMPIDTSHR